MLCYLDVFSCQFAKEILRYHQWINQADASHQRTAGRPWSHYDPALKKGAVGLVSEGMDGGSVASALGVSSAAVVCNWVRSSETAKERDLQAHIAHR